MSIHKSALAGIIAATYLAIIVVVLGILYLAPGETIGGISVFLTVPSYLLSDWLGIYAESRLGELAILGTCAVLNALIIYSAATLLENSLTKTIRRRQRKSPDPAGQQSN